ncbi:glycoside hydrolase family 2 TIM barrel-domain containing protein [Pedobacter sp. SYSU D00535]|uniref:glycoside hydrolase family 2 TIM barrel-domain containing protein n=1 Tax=Pedobacter sp. SYSU D00535 TaxID=2810308 RepID=UPI001A96B8D6|nr:glycoside hydrolase family 2 TIM barrel-domain containing protein [Pedobacter sp. SYSU D00535]
MLKSILKIAVAVFAISNVSIAKTEDQKSSLKAVKVEVRNTGSGFQLYRDGKPYFIKGAGGSKYLSRLAAYGGNSIRTWSTDNAAAVLDSAQKYGLTVLMGLPAAAERHGFNYDDPVAVKKQFDRIKSEVMKYKDHPALLGWGIGNELNLSYKNPKVWDAVNDIAKMIHEVDPNHPASTVLAGINKSEIDYIKAKATAIDFLCINTYGGLAELPQRVAELGWTGPYIVTEWGPTGHWEGLSTKWKAPVEETSSEKAAVYKSRYSYSVEKDREKCLGSYVFLWGQKQERTPTWYGLFTDKGEESEVVDVMQYLWKGTYPENKAPHIYAFQLDGKKANLNVYLKAGKTYPANVLAIDPDNDQLNYYWELLPEATKVGEGGDHEDKPAPVTFNYKQEGKGKISFSSPQKEGAYRLFVYVRDGKNKVATANIPFFVGQESERE